MDYDAVKKILEHERLPAAFVDLEAFDANINHAAEILKEKGSSHNLRLATKSVRVPALIRRVLDYGPPYKGLMCYSAEEAAFLADQGFDDLLIAYPTVQESDLTALRYIHNEGKTVCLMVDDADVVARISRFMGELDRPFRLVLDVDMSLRYMDGRLHLGVRRSPIRNLGDVLRMYETAAGFPNIKLIGLMGYEAQLAGLSDQNPFNKIQMPLTRWIRKKSKASVSELRGEIAEVLKRRGYEIELFNGGGTGSLNITSDEPWLTELAAGSGFLCSHLFDYFSNIRFEPACFFACQVARRSDQGYATCQGGGYIASGAVGWDKQPLPWLPQGLRLVSTEGCGEVQTPVRLPQGFQPKQGDPIVFRHAKAGEPAERFNEYLLVEDGRIVDRVKTYRGHGKCFF